MADWWEGDDDYSWLDDTVGEYSDDDYGFDSWLDDYSGDEDYGFDSIFDDINWDDFSFDDYQFNAEEDLGFGGFDDWMENYFESGASTEGIDYNELFPDLNLYGIDTNDPYDFSGGLDFGEETGIFGGTAGPKIRDFFAELFGNPGKNPPRSGNKMGGIGQYLGDFLSSPLAALLLMKDQYDGRKADLYIPKGQEAYGSGAGVGSLPDYRISNIQPALLPGMAYANQPTTFNNTPPGMQTGGLTSHHHPQLHSHGPTPGIERGPGLPPPPASKVLFGDGMQAGGIASLENRMEGPGDITQAMLEPGEFVMTRKATQNLTPEYLYNLMHQAENAGRMT